MTEIFLILNPCKSTMMNLLLLHLKTPLRNGWQRMWPTCWFFAGMPLRPKCWSAKPSTDGRWSSPPSPPPFVWWDNARSITEESQVSRYLWWHNDLTASMNFISGFGLSHWTCFFCYLSHSGDLLLWVGIRHSPSQELPTGQSVLNFVCSICSVRRQEIVIPPSPSNSKGR